MGWASLQAGGLGYEMDDRVGSNCARRPGIGAIALAGNHRRGAPAAQCRELANLRAAPRCRALLSAARWLSRTAGRAPASRNRAARLFAAKPVRGLRRPRRLRQPDAGVQIGYGVETPISLSCLSNASIVWSATDCIFDASSRVILPSCPSARMPERSN